MWKNIQKWISAHPFMSGLMVNGVFWLLAAIIGVVRTLIKEEKLIESFKSVLEFSISVWIILVTVFVVTIIIVIFRSRKFKYDDDTLRMDQNLFNTIRYDILPQDGVIKFLRDHNFGFTFGNSQIDGLHEYYHKKDNSDFEFLNPELESLKNELTEAIFELRKKVTVNTIGFDGSIQGVSKELADVAPDIYNNIIEDLNSRAEVVCNKYDKFVRTGRNVLRI